MATMCVYEKPGFAPRFVILPNDEADREVFGVLGLDFDRFEFCEDEECFRSLEGEVLNFYLFDEPSEFFI